MIAKVPDNDNGNDNEFGIEKRETSASAPDGFDRFWSAYPRKISKQEALRAWKQINPDPDTVEKIIAGVEAWKKSEQWTKDGGEYICYPQKFLRQRYWESDPRPATGGNTPPSGPPVKDYDGDEDFLTGGKG